MTTERDMTDEELNKLEQADEANGKLVNPGEGDAEDLDEDDEDFDSEDEEDDDEFDEDDADDDDEE